MVDQTDAQTAYENPAGGKDAASAMYEKGADVVFHAAGKSGLGVFQAAAAAGKGKWAIGVDSDQYLTAPKDQQGHILTSALKRIDTSVYDEIKSFQDKTLKPGFVNYNLKTDGVGYATSGGFVDELTGVATGVLSTAPVKWLREKTGILPPNPDGTDPFRPTVLVPAARRPWSRSLLTSGRQMPGRHVSASPGHQSACGRPG